MSVIQPRLKISNEALAGIMRGDLTRRGGVVYHKTGGIFEHLKDTSLSESPGVKGINKEVLAFGLGIVAVGAITGLAIWFFKSKKAKRLGIGAETLQRVEGYNSSLCTYLEKLRNGQLDIGTINLLIFNLDYINEKYRKDKLKIEFSTRQINALVNLTFDYTSKLAKANSVEFSGIKEFVISSNDNKLSDLQRYLVVQKQIFERYHI